MLQIVCDDDFFYDSKGKMFTCTFYCQTETGAFPDEEWTDFAEKLLLMWSSVILSISCAEETSFYLYFLDGPFWISGRKQGDEVTLSFDTDKYSMYRPADVHIQFRELASELERAMRRLTSCLFLSGKSDSSQRMKEMSEQLRRAILHPVL